MKRTLKHIFVIVVSIWAAFSSISILANWVPWYSQETPLVVASGVYGPGQEVPVDIWRTSLLGMQARNLIELVHLHDGKEREIWKYTKDIYLQAGEGLIEVFYDIPLKVQCAQLETNTYKFRGIITYNPLGYLDKSFEWETEKFQIVVR